jgi:cytochrome c peroxidase
MGSAQLGWPLSDQQIVSIVAFLRTLTGTYRGKPVVGASP